MIGSSNTFLVFSHHSEKVKRSGVCPGDSVREESTNWCDRAQSLALVSNRSKQKPKDALKSERQRPRERERERSIPWGTEGITEVLFEWKLQKSGMGTCRAFSGQEWKSLEPQRVHRARKMWVMVP